MNFSEARGTCPIEISIHSDRLSIQIYGQKTDLKVLNIFSIKTYQIFPAGSAEALDLNRGTLKLTLKKFLKLHPFKMSTHQMLTQAAMTKQVEFPKQMLQMFDDEEIDPDRIVFSDEAHFWLNGYVNKQSYYF